MGGSRYAGTKGEMRAVVVAVGSDGEIPDASVVLRLLDVARVLTPHRLFWRSGRLPTQQQHCARANDTSGDADHDGAKGWVARHCRRRAGLSHKHGRLHGFTEEELKGGESLDKKDMTDFGKQTEGVNDNLTTTLFVITSSPSRHTRSLE